MLLPGSGCDKAVGVSEGGGAFPDRHPVKQGGEFGGGLCSMTPSMFQFAMIPCRGPPVLSSAQMASISATAPDLISRCGRWPAETGPRAYTRTRPRMIVTMRGMRGARA